MQVGTTLRTGIVGVPAGGDGSEELDIVLIRAGIEDQRVPKAWNRAK